MFIFTYQSKYPPHPPLPHTTTCTGHAYQSVAASTSAFGPFFLSSFLQGGKVVKKKKRHEDASTPSSSRRRRRPRDVVGEVSDDDVDDDRVARVSRHGAAFRAVRDRGTACGAHLFFFFFFASRFGCVSLSLFRAPSSPFVAHRKVAISVVWKAFSTRNKVSCFPMRGVNSRYHHHHHHHLSLSIYKGSVRIRRRRPLRRPLPRASFAALFLLPR